MTVITAQGDNVAVSKKPRGAGRGEVSYRIDVRIAGREGTQEEIVRNKREAIRRAKGLIKDQPFGSAVSVQMRDFRGDRRFDTLIFQAHVAYARRKRGQQAGERKTVLKIDEL